jgi:hypothetical protein
VLPNHSLLVISKEKFWCGWCCERVVRRLSRRKSVFAENWSVRFTPGFVVLSSFPIAITFLHFVLRNLESFGFASIGGFLRRNLQILHLVPDRAHALIFLWRTHSKSDRLLIFRYDAASEAINHSDCAILEVLGPGFMCGAPTSRKGYSGWR